MYRRPKFLELLLDIRQEMAREADYDADLFAELVRTGVRPFKVSKEMPKDNGAKTGLSPKRSAAYRSSRS